MITSRIAVALISAVALSCAAFAAPPEWIQFSGRLTDDAGVPLDGPQSVVFSVFDAISAGTSQWTSGTLNLIVDNGLLEHSMGCGGDNVCGNGDDSPIDPSVFADGSHWLEVTINGASLAPRQPIGSVPHALSADRLATSAGDYRMSLDLTPGDLYLTQQSTGAPAGSMNFWMITQPNISPRIFFQPEGDVGQEWTLQASAGAAIPSENRLTLLQAGTEVAQFRNVDFALGNDTGLGGTLRLRNGTGSFHDITTSADSLLVQSDAGTAIEVDRATGHVGLGGVDPQARLSVDGDLHVAGTVRAGRTAGYEFDSDEDGGYSANTWTAVVSVYDLPADSEVPFPRVFEVVIATHQFGFATGFWEYRAFFGANQGSFNTQLVSSHTFNAPTVPEVAWSGSGTEGDPALLRWRWNQDAIGGPQVYVTARQVGGTKGDVLVFQ